MAEKPDKSSDINARPLSSQSSAANICFWVTLWTIPYLPTWHALFWGLQESHGDKMGTETCEIVPIWRKVQKRAVPFFSNHLSNSAPKMHFGDNLGAQFWASKNPELGEELKKVFFVHRNLNSAPPSNRFIFVIWQLWHFFRQYVKRLTITDLNSNHPAIK